MSQDVHFVTDDCLWILYADRQGCIQSHGFDFIRDLPTFFVFLNALERFTLTDWGLNPRRTRKGWSTTNTAVRMNRRIG